VDPCRLHPSCSVIVMHRSLVGVGELCCSELQVVLLADYALYVVACLLIWRSRVLLPLKLFTVFLHELGHALAVWLTCNKVHGIEVHADQGGLTHWSARTDKMRCVQHVVLPAGYLGSAAWGGAILVCCSRSGTTEAMTVVLAAMLLVALGYSLCGRSNASQDRTLTWLCIGMLALLVGMLYVCWRTDWPYRYLMLNKVLLLLGTMNTLFATYDIWEDCVGRTVERSDAYKYAQLLHGACSPKCVGIVWLSLSLLMAFGALSVALLRLPPARDVSSITDLSGFSVLCIVIPGAVCVAALLFRMCCSSAYGKRVRITRGVKLSDPVGEVSEDKCKAELQRSALGKAMPVFTTGMHSFGSSSGEDDSDTSDSGTSSDSSEGQCVA